MSDNINSYPENKQNMHTLSEEKNLPKQKKAADRPPSLNGIEKQQP